MNMYSYECLKSLVDNMLSACVYEISLLIWNELDFKDIYESMNEWD